MDMDKNGLVLVSSFLPRTLNFFPHPKGRFDHDGKAAFHNDAITHKAVDGAFALIYNRYLVQRVSFVLENM